LACVSSWGAAAEDVHLYFIGGQSNATGRALASEIPPGSPLANPQTDVAFYYRNTFGPANNTLPEEQIIDLAPGSGHGGSGTGVEFGPELAIGRTLADALPGQNIMLVKGTRGGSNLYTQWSSTGDDYADFIVTANDAIAAVVAAGDNPILMGMFWVQGEADANDATNAANYGANLTDLIGRVRTDLFGGADAPFVLSQLSNNQYSTLPVGFSQVRSGQTAVASTVANTALVLTDDDTLYTTRLDEAIHFDANGQINLGAALGQEMVAFVPEPSSLMLLSLTGLLVARRRRD